MSEQQCACDCGCSNDFVMLPVRLAVDKSALGETGSGIDYSFEEQWTGRLWVDGKKIYQKTVNCGALPNSTSKEVRHGIAGLDYVVAFDGTAQNPATGMCHHIRHVSPTASSYSVYCTVTRDVVSFMTRQAYGDDAKTFVTILYTCTDR